MVDASENWPASSTTSRSRLSRGTRAGFAKSHAVPPRTKPLASRSAANSSWPLRRSAVNPGDSADPLGTFPTSAASRPVATTRSSRFSTTACDWATTPTRQPCSATRRAITCAPRYDLPVPGGPWTARYDESRSRRLAVTAAMRPLPSSGPSGARMPERVRGGVRRSRSTVAFVGQLSDCSAVSRPLPHSRIASASGRVLGGAAGVSALGR